MIYLFWGLSYFLLVVFEGNIPAEIIFIAKSVFISAYLSYEIFLERKRNKENWSLSPAVLASFFTFILGFGITNLIYLVPGTPISNWLYDKFGPDPFPILNTALDIVMIGGFSMWIGYKTNLGNKLFDLLTTKIIYLKKYFRKSYEIKIDLVWFFVIVSVIARLYAIYLGIYGYSQSPEQVSEYIGIAQLLYYLGLLSYFSLIVVSLAYFSNSQNINLRIFLILIVLTEIFFGILSGMKVAMLVPVMIPFFCYLIIKRRIKKSLVFSLVLIIILAYMIIEPFRILRYMDRNFQSNPTYIIDTFIEAYNYREHFSTLRNIPISLSIVTRLNYTIDLAKAIEYKDKVGLAESDPGFLYKLYTVPFQAIIPRAIWNTKPDEYIGGWFTRKVWGLDIMSSTAMTPFGFLYFAGGMTLIAPFFFLFGIMQRALFNFLKLGSGGIVVFIGLLSTLVLIDSSVNGTFVTWIRHYPVLIFLQYIVIKK